MKRLHLLRHAKSSWDDAALADRDRPLAPRGRRAAARLSDWLETSDVRPELVLCSTALRARETLEGVHDALGGPEVAYLDGLYHAWEDALLTRIRAVPDTIDEVLLVGHNPGLGNLVLDLAADSRERQRIEGKLPTGALVSLQLDAVRWADVASGGGRIVSLVLPRDLAPPPA
ncbi:MAG TPA: histidine phosphatase family protein [Gaiella sp.]|jgi:phosphohistidine phosphatase